MQSDADGAAVAKALGHPTRYRLLRALGDDGATVSQLAHRLAVNKGNIAHHLGVLETAGLVRRGRTRTVRGGTERYFERTRRRLRVEDPDGDSAAALLATVAAELPRTGRPLLHARQVRLTHQQAQALARHLDEVVTELEDRPGEQEFSVLVALYPRGSG